jgi:hypothetical protein
MSAVRLKIFISSVQKEFQQIRMDLKAFLLGDPFLRRFIAQVFLFEEIPAKDRHADKVYLEEVKRCDVYLGIFGYDYGFADQDGVSPTEREYDHATQLGKTRLIYVWGADEKLRSAKMKELIQKASAELVRRRVADISALTASVYASLVDYLDDIGVLHIHPFDASVCDGTALHHLSRKRVDWFLATARKERGFPLKASTSTTGLLARLNLLYDAKPTNSAVLLFGENPQRFLPTAEIKCVHCHGTVYRRPFASLQTYGGDIFAQADQGRDFILSKINRSVGTRDAGITAPAKYELPPDAVGEAIVNAIAHRNYHSNASVEVRLFSDRLEIWNPGRLPSGLTIDSLREDHPSVPNNPLLAESLYLARYIEKVGSGTQAMIGLCRESGLPEPEFEERHGSFIVTLWRHWLTDQVLGKYNLNERQIRAIAYLKSNERITNADYQKLSGANRKTAARDLDVMVERGIVDRLGEKRGIHYVLKVRK